MPIKFEDLDLSKEDMRIIIDGARANVPLPDEDDFEPTEDPNEAPPIVERR